MKITAISALHTDEGKAGFKTDPPLTEAIYWVARLYPFGTAHLSDGSRIRDFASWESDVLIISKSSFTPQDIAVLDDALSKAEIRWQEQQAAAAARKASFQQRVADQTGLLIAE